MAKKPRHDEDGRELLDPTPVAIPARFTRPQTEMDRFREFLNSEEMRKAAHAAGLETIDEANDFDIGDDDDLPVTEEEMAGFEYGEDDFSPPPAPKDGGAEKIPEQSEDNAADEAAEDST